MTARTGVVYRPAGSITSERGLFVLVIATRRLVTLMERVTAAERSVAADPTPEYAALEARVSESLRTSAGLVAHEVEDGDGLAALTAARLRCAQRGAGTLGGRGAAEGWRDPRR